MFNYLFLLLTSICLLGCSGPSQQTTTQPKIGEKQSGLFVEHGPRHGFQYVDSAGMEYNARYFSLPLTNDTVIPIQLEVYFPEAARNIIDSTHSKVFLLPRNLTPDGLFFDHNLTNLQRFMDAGVYNGEHLNKTLQPCEKCILAFGVLTNIKYPDPTFPIGGKLVTTIENESTVSLKLEISDTLISPCGKLIYLKK